MKIYQENVHCISNELLVFSCILNFIFIFLVLPTTPALPCALSVMTRTLWNPFSLLGSPTSWSAATRETTLLRYSTGAPSTSSTGHALWPFTPPSVSNNVNLAVNLKLTVLRYLQLTTIPFTGSMVTPGFFTNVGNLVLLQPDLSMFAMSVNWQCWKTRSLSYLALTTHVHCIYSLLFHSMWSGSLVLLQPDLSMLVISTFFFSTSGMLNNMWSLGYYTL